MSHLTTRPFRELLAAFADPSPTPGGGSAAALTASVGLALLAMVAAMNKTRHGSDEDRASLDRSREAVGHLGDHAAALVDDDAAAYDAVVAAYRRPRATDEERAARRRAIEAALRGAAETPLEVMRTCRAGLAEAVHYRRGGQSVGIDRRRRGGRAAGGGRAECGPERPGEPGRARGSRIRGGSERRDRPTRSGRGIAGRGGENRPQLRVTTSTWILNSQWRV